MTTWSVSEYSVSMSSSVVPTSSPVMYSPPSWSIIRPIARISASVLSVLGSPMMTALPPPRFTPAAAYLYVIPRASRSASMIAPCSSAYVHIRSPPAAGPSAVEWIAITARSPVALSLQSWSFLKRCSRR